jgi:hypothetical protein
VCVIAEAKSLGYMSESLHAPITVQFVTAKAAAKKTKAMWWHLQMAKR